MENQKEKNHYDAKMKKILIERIKIETEEIKTVKNFESLSSDEDKKEAIPCKAHTAAKYRVALAPRGDIYRLELISLPILEASKGRINFLFDIGTTISLIKLKLRNDAKIYEEQIRLTGITGHTKT